MNKYNIHNLINSLILLGLICFMFINHNKGSESVAYIDSQRLFNEFNMTKDLVRIDQPKFNKLTRHIDSLYAVLQVYSEKESDEARALQLQIVHINQELQERQETFSTELNAKVWTRLKLYMEEFGAKKKLKIILGQTHNGTVLFFEPKIDITAEALAFINKKYEGLPD